MIKSNTTTLDKSDKSDKSDKTIKDTLSIL